MVKYWPERGKSGFIVWRYLLRRDDEAPAPWTNAGKQRIEQLGLTMQVTDWANHVLLSLSLSLSVCLSFTPCGFWGCKNGPAPFPGQMSYTATKPGLVSVLYLSIHYMVSLFIRAPFYVLLVFIAMYAVFWLFWLSVLAK